MLNKNCSLVSKKMKEQLICTTFWLLSENINTNYPNMENVTEFPGTVGCQGVAHSFLLGNFLGIFPLYAVPICRVSSNQLQFILLFFLLIYILYITYKNVFDSLNRLFSYCVKSYYLYAYVIIQLKITYSEIALIFKKPQ